VTRSKRAPPAARFTRWLSLAAALGVTACAVGPDYHRPKLDAAADYKEAGDWKPSEPNDALNRGPWWEIYNDDALNQLEVRIDISNENVKAAAAAFDQARALVAQARAGFWPTVSASASRQQRGGARHQHCAVFHHQQCGRVGELGLGYMGEDTPDDGEQSCFGAIKCSRARRRTPLRAGGTRHRLF
jgi:hypothetical protein